MSIISQTTWDNFTQEEKEQIKSRYKFYGNKKGGYDCMKELEELFGEETLQPQLTYEDVARELFEEGAWQPHDYASKYQFDKNATHTYFLNCTSQKQAEKLLAINKLLNVCAWADMRNELTIEISAELTEKINGIISDEELKLILSNDY